MTERLFRRGWNWERLTGLLVVLALHAAVISILWQYQIRLTPQEAITVFVNFINPPPPATREEPPKPKPRPTPVAPPPPVPQQIVVETPVVLPDEPVAPPPPAIEAPPAPSGPVRLTTELAVSCPSRVPPDYPIQARRRGVQGRVVLRVELDATGRISQALIETSSGSSWLDQAALAAVKSWRCTPAMREGVAVAAVALQPFVFKLEGR
jgi:protein TonB